MWFYDLNWFVLTDLCKIPFDDEHREFVSSLPITEAPVPDESDHVLAFGCVDLGYAYVRDTKENVKAVVAASSVDVEAPSGAAAEGSCVGCLSYIYGARASMASSTDALAACETLALQAAKLSSWIAALSRSSLSSISRSSCQSSSA